MSVNFGFSFPALAQYGGGGNNPFGQLGPTLDMSFVDGATGVTNLNDPNGYTLTTNFITPEYQVAAQYTIWETNVGLVSKTFSQIITFTRATSATFTGSNGLIQSAAIDAPRFDYDPVTLAAKGLLIEEQRTNLLVYSEDFSNPAWSNSNITVTPNATVSPTGAINAQRLTATTTSATSVVQDAVVNATSASFTVYAKQDTGANDMNKFVIRNTTTATNLLNIDVNYATGAVTYVIGSSGASMRNVGNGWWRIELSVSSGITSGNTIRVYSGSGGGVLNAGVAAFFWGAQLEAGAFPTSYIPTVASQVTRSADVASVNTLSPWYNATEGTLYVEADSFVNVTTVTAYPSASLNDGTNTNLIRIFVYNGSWGGSVRTLNIVQCDLQQIGSYIANAIAKTTIAFKTNDFAVSVNGNSVLTDASGSIPVVDRLSIGQNTVGGPFINGHIRRITYYPRRLSNAELQAITA